jgi:quercetin dioxygenase-like cupin family protein
MQNDTSHDLLPKLVPLDGQGNGFSPVLEGPPESITLRSGHVMLQTGESVGKHTTGTCEELLVVLAGRGEMSFAAHAPLQLIAPCAAYCPPHTEHDVKNTGPEVLRYVYVVARVQSFSCRSLHEGGTE